MEALAAVLRVILGLLIDEYKRDKEKSHEAIEVTTDPDIESAWSNIDRV